MRSVRVSNDDSVFFGGSFLSPCSSPTFLISDGVAGKWLKI